eukprot:m.113236 g.113236  ORF g.113236 m.113236 type:complete len:333 (+) comp13506_c2_seq3:273-1271(+)
MDGKETKEKDQASFTQQRAFLAGECRQIQNISLRHDVSTGVGLFGKSHQVESLVGMEQGEHRTATILVILSDKEDQMRSVVSSDNSLIPNDFTTVQNYDDPEVVLYNSHSHWHNDKLSASVVTNREGREMTLKFTCREPFKVLVYTAMPFDKTASAQGLLAHFDRQKEECQRAIETFDRQTKEAREEINQAKETIGFRESQIVEAEHTVAEQSKKYTLLVDQFDHATLPEAISEITAAQEMIAQLSQSEELQLIQQTGDIFQANDLKTSLNSKLSRHATVVQNILRFLKHTEDHLRPLLVGDSAAHSSATHTAAYASASMLKTYASPTSTWS